MDKQFYSCENFIFDLFEKSFRSMPYSANSLEEHNKWKKEAKAKLSQLLSKKDFERVDLNPVVIEEQRLDGYTRVLMHIQTLKGVIMPFYILVPDKKNGVAVLALHSHNVDGKNGLVGVSQASISFNSKRFNSKFATAFVSKGYTVICPDLAGSGDRREFCEQIPEKIESASCNNINNALISLGTTLRALVNFELMRLIDYIKESELVQCERLFCTGFSGGALAAVFLAAFDERIEALGISGYFHSYKGTVMRNNLCGCNFIPELWEYFDFADIVAFVAPRPMFFETGASDPLNGVELLENVYDQIEIVKSAYNNFGLDYPQYEICAGSHKWFGKVIDFFDSII